MFVALSTTATEQLGPQKIPAAPDHARGPAKAVQNDPVAPLHHVVDRDGCGDGPPIFVVVFVVLGSSRQKQVLLFVFQPRVLRLGGCPNNQQIRMIGGWSR